MHHSIKHFYIAAIFFHASSLFMLLIFFVGERVSDKIVNLFFALMIISLFLSLFNLPEVILRSILDLDLLTEFFPYISYKINFYLNNDYYLNQPLNLYALRFFLVGLIFFVFSKKLNGEVYLLVIYFIYTSLVLLLGFNIQFYTRLGVFVNFIEIIIVSVLYSKAQRNIKPLP
jgi:hypothetical protein